jgi:hypothetical protein
MSVESDRIEAFKIGLIPVDQLSLEFECIWFYDGKIISNVIIKSPIVGSDGMERIRVDHIKDGKIREGGYININELYTTNSFLVFSCIPQIHF